MGGSAFSLPGVPTMPPPLGGIFQAPTRPKPPTRTRTVAQAPRPAPPQVPSGNVVTWGGAGPVGTTPTMPGPSDVPQTLSGGPNNTPQSYGSEAFDPTYMNGAGGTFSAQRPAGATGMTGNTWNTPPKTTGVLSAPGALEDFWSRNGSKFDSPFAGEGVMGEAAGIFRNKSNAQSLYDSGNQGLNTFYDRESQKRQGELERQMSASGMFGSGAMAKGMYELQGELGASQARDMADLARAADNSEQGRASGLFGAGHGMASSELSRLDTGGNMAGSVQDHFERRNRYALQDKMGLAQNLSSIFGDMATKSTDEQATIINDIVQGMVSESGLGIKEAEQKAQEQLQAMGLGLKAYELYKSRYGGGRSDYGDGTMQPNVITHGP